MKNKTKTDPLAIAAIQEQMNIACDAINLKQFTAARLSFEQCAQLTRALELTAIADASEAQSTAKQLDLP